MNRADQAPEPSIEELLASIRLIISDADKQSPAPTDSRALGAPAGANPAARVPGEVSADEVFDLTDELMFPEAATRPRLAAPQAPARGQPGPEAHPAARAGAALQPAENEHVSAPVHAGHEPRAEPAQAGRPEPRKQAQAQADRPVWSRRDQPAGMAQSAAAARPRHEPPAARPTARNWAEDIQLPVTEQGPVSLFPFPPKKGQPGIPGAEEDGALTVEAEPAGPQGEGEGAVAVAVLAHRLARSAMGVLEASELEAAKQVDFEHLDDTSKAEVTEKFADAIESAAQVVPEEPAPVEAKAPKPAPQGRQAAANTAAAAPAPASEPRRDGKGEAAVKPEAPAKADAKAETRTKKEAKKEVRAEPAPVPEHLAAEVVKAEAGAGIAPAKPPVAPAPLAVQPLAQAQFMGAAQMPVPSQGGGALENVVREMLRPLLVQWLNENMPRILENAIRDEIAMRGLLPKSDS